MPNLLRDVPKPPRIARLPRNRQQYPIPWFVETLPDGSRDFRVASHRRHIEALRFGLCWVCGTNRGTYAAFTLGPMCAVNRISAEPPAHRDCAVYSATVCPFLSTPTMVRRDRHLPEDLMPAAGHTISRNPGVALVWVTRTFKAFRPELGADGWLCRIGDPTDLLWFAQGRTATRAEILASMESGLPALQDACRMDDDPAGSLRMLDDEYAKALQLVPTC